MRKELSAAHAGTIALGGDLTVARLGFGAMRITGEGVWGDPPDRDRAKATLRRALELGITFVDTADSYGPEVSETLIAEALYPYPDDLVIATKGGLVRPGPGKWEPDGRPEYLREVCEGSLRRLRLDQIPLYQFHRPDPKVPVAESVGALAELKAAGKIRHIGVSNFSGQQLHEAQGITPIVSVQNRYNAADRSSDSVVDLCEQEGLVFLPWAPIQQSDANHGGRGRRPAARRDAAPDRDRLAAGAVAGDAADSRHRIARPPRGERGRGGHRAESHRGGGDHRRDLSTRPALAGVRSCGVVLSGR